MCVPPVDVDLMAPLSGPDLVRINGTHTYEVTIPEELGLFDTPSLVFQIEDQSSPGDYVYQWMVDVQFDRPSVNLNPPVVDLTAYSCRTVSVSYAFATTMGLSKYSQATVIDVPGTVDHEQTMTVSYNSLFCSPSWTYQIDLPSNSIGPRRICFLPEIQYRRPSY